MQTKYMHTKNPIRQDGEDGEDGDCELEGSRHVT